MKLYKYTGTISEVSFRNRTACDIKLYDMNDRDKAPTRLEVFGVALTMFDGRNRLTRQVQDEVNRCFPDQIFKTVIPRTVRLSEAPSFGKSILHYDIKSKGSEAYLSLAKEIVMRKPGSRTAKAE